MNLVNAVPFIIAGMLLGAMFISVLQHHAPKMRAYIARQAQARRRKAQ